MEDLKFCTIDLFAYIEERNSTSLENESVYTLEIKRVDLNAIYDGTSKLYDALRRAPPNPA